jgi:hypothetical protein
METASHYGNTSHARIHRKKNDPIFQKKDGSWWFYDETWTDTCGPYETEEEAQEMLHYYVQVELRG